MMDLYPQWMRQGSGGGTIIIYRTAFMDFADLSLEPAADIEMEADDDLDLLLDADLELESDDDLSLDADADLEVSDE